MVAVEEEVCLVFRSGEVRNLGKWCEVGGDFWGVWQVFSVDG